MSKIFGLAMVCAAAGMAQAQVWNEIPDAPDAAPFTAQETSGSGPLLQIIGGPGSGVVSDSVDAYCIYISDPAHFSATTVGGTGMDSQLWLFREDGTGIAFNDDSVGFQSTLTNAFVTAPGEYIIAVSPYDVDALDAAGGELWSDTPFGVERAPDGPGAGNAVFGWSSGPELSNYTIFLTGATYCVPAPGAAALLGLGGLMAGRRRR